MNWGAEVADKRHAFSHKDDLLALVSLESTEKGGKELDKKTIHKVMELLTNRSGDKQLAVLRSQRHQLLVKFSSTQFYETLGKCFLDGKLEAVGAFKLVELQGEYRQTLGITD